MSVLSSPSSECLTLDSREFKVNPKVLEMLVRVLTCCHGILHYHMQTRELATFQWSMNLYHGKGFFTHMYTIYRPIDRYGRKIHPSLFEAYREAHIFRYPCCFCAMGGRYVEVSIFRHPERVCQGEYVSECAISSCCYMCKSIYTYRCGG